MDVVLKCTEIDVQEKSIQLLWDLDMQSGRNAASVLNVDDLLALGKVLCSTQECEIASHIIHFLKHSLDQPPESRPRRQACVPMIHRSISNFFLSPRPAAFSSTNIPIVLIVLAV